MKRTSSCILLLVVAMLGAVLYWLLLPALSLKFMGSTIFIEIFVLLITFLVTNFVVGRKELEKAAGVTAIVFGILFVVDLLVFLGSIIPLFNWGERYNLLGNGSAENIKEVTFQEMIEEIDTSQIPIVDYDTAYRLADKKLGEDSALGSILKLGKGSKMEVKGEIIYVFPLEHSGFFQWKRNKSVPGYITVSASNTSKVEFHRGYTILYSTSSYFGYDLERHLRFNGCLTDGLTEYTFELTDDMQPMHVVTTYKNLTGWTTPEATGVVICDPQTGKVEKYSIEDVPDWVDIVQPDQFIAKQINWWGEYVNGVFNFSDFEKIKKTNQILTVYNNKDCYYFTGMTSVGGDNSLTGFMMVNTRTKDTFYAKMGGVTEDAAMEAAQSLWDDFGYYAVEPLPINCEGVSTYAVAVKSTSSNMITGYSFVNAKDISIVARGETLRDAAKAYAKKISNAGIGYAASDKAHRYDLSGEIFRINSEVQEGNTYYSFIFTEDLDKLFTCGYAVSEELAITKEGDHVSITYIDDGNGSFSVYSFENDKFSTVISDNQQRRDELDADAKPEDAVLKVDPEENENWWDSLTDEEKAEIMSGQTDK